MKLETVPITLAMKASVDAIRARCGHTAASHAFASLYIWQEEMGLSILLRDEIFAVKCAWRGENAWFFPCGGEASVRALVARLLETPNLRLCYLREEDAAFLKREFPGQISLSERDSDHEYLYDRAEQETLQGRKFSGIRNHIHRAESDHTLTWEPLCEANIADALAISRAWQRQSDGPNGLADCYASEALLLHAAQLGMRGVIISVDSEPYALVAGYPLSANTFDISAAKQKNHLSGVSVYAKHALICSLPKAYTTLNAEEDLGIDGLRTMKKQMQPIGQIKMYEGEVMAYGA